MFYINVNTVKNDMVESEKVLVVKAAARNKHKLKTKNTSRCNIRDLLKPKMQTNTIHAYYVKTESEEPSQDDGQAIRPCAALGLSA